MEFLRKVWTPPRRWWLLGGLVVLVCLAGLFPLRASQAPPATSKRAAAPTAAEVPTLRWNYTPAAPDRFVVRRSVDGGTWQDVAVLPGASGTGLTWEDTTLPASEVPQAVRYAVYAVAGTGEMSVWSKASNIAVTTVGEEPPVPLGECVAVKKGKKKVIISCTQP